MRALAWDGAYALPDGYIPPEFRIAEHLRFIGKEMFGALEAQKMIEKIKPPKKIRKDYIFVWSITDKGLDWLENAEKNPQKQAIEAAAAPHK